MYYHSIRPRIILALAGIICFLPGCNRCSDYITEHGAVWNTTYTIKYKNSLSLADSIQYILREVETSLSPFNPSSKISAINNGSSNQVDSLIEDVFNISLQVNAASGGAFDPTLSPLINLWGFGYTGKDCIEPSDSAIAEALKLTGLQECGIRDGVMYKKAPETTFNFSAVTKGYGCDLIAGMMRRNGVTDYMIEIGGELSLSGVNPHGEKWRVMIDAPVDTVASHTRLVTIDVTDCAIATSGNYRNFHDISNGRVGHTISALTGRPVVTSTLSATVIAPTCAMADALATACMAMDSSCAVSMINNIAGTSCMLVIDNQDSLKIVTSEDFTVQYK